MYTLPYDATPAGCPHDCKICSARHQSGTVGAKKRRARRNARCAARPTPMWLPAPNACGAIVSIAASGADAIICPATLKHSEPILAPANAVVSLDQRPTKAIVMETRDSLVKSTSIMGTEATKKLQPSASKLVVCTIATWIRVVPATPCAARKLLRFLL